MLPGKSTGDGKILQTRCWIASAGHLWMGAYFDNCRGRLRRGAQARHYQCRPGQAADQKPAVAVARLRPRPHGHAAGARRPVESMTNGLLMSDVFNRVYATNYWGNAESRSGHGSDLKQTAIVRVGNSKFNAGLPMRATIFGCENAQDAVETYIAAGIVQSMIHELNERYGSAYRRFEVLDLTQDALPKVDLVLLSRFASAFFFKRYPPRYRQPQAKWINLPVSDDLHRPRSQYGHFNW
jgi:hypothetical protein